MGKYMPPMAPLDETSANGGIASEPDDEPPLEHIPTPTSPTETEAAMVAWLQYLADPRMGPDRPGVFQEVLSFQTNDEKRRWQDHGLHSIQRTVSTIVAKGLLGGDAAFGLVIAVPNSLFVGIRNRNRDHQTLWHQMAFGLLNNEGGPRKALLVYSNELRPLDTANARARDVLTPVTLAFYEKLKERGHVSLWVNHPVPSEQGSGRCVELSCRRLMRWLEQGNGRFCGENDPRVHRRFWRVRHN